MFNSIYYCFHSGKSLGEWRSAESKSKKQSFASARENEKLQDAMLDIRLANPNNTKLSTSTLHLHSQKVVSDKENAKVSSTHSLLIFLLI